MRLSLLATLPSLHQTRCLPVQQTIPFGHILDNSHHLAYLSYTGAVTYYPSAILSQALYLRSQKSTFHAFNKWLFHSNAWSLASVFSQSPFLDSSTISCLS